MRRLASRGRLALLASGALGVAVLAGGGALAPATEPVAAGLATPTPAPPTPTPTPAPMPSSSPAPTATPEPTIIVVPTPAIPEARLQATLERYRARYGIPGISVAMLWPDGRSWTGTTGLAVVRTKQPVTTDTAFAVASVTKTFTAALVLQLAEEGRLRLDDRAATLLPALGLDRRITVRMLLDHTSGLYDYFDDPRIDVALRRAPTEPWTRERTLTYVAKPYFKPGKGWHYSNANYLVLGMVAEQVTGSTLAALFRARFFDPLGLESAYYQVAERPRGPLAHGYQLGLPGPDAKATDLWDGTGVVPFTAVVTAADGAGAVAASPLDLARWAQALYGGAVLAPDTMAEMLDVNRTRPLKPRMLYGLGVQRLTINGRQTFGHSGRFAAFRAQMRFVPAKGISIAVLSNQGRVDVAKLVEQLLAVVDPPPAPPPSPGPTVTPTATGP